MNSFGFQFNKVNNFVKPHSSLFSSLDEIKMIIMQIIEMYCLYNNIISIHNYMHLFLNPLLQLIEYNDKDDKADLKYAEKYYNISNSWKIWSFEDFDWDNSFNISGNNSEEFIFRVSKSNKLNFTSNGFLQIKVNDNS